MTADQLVSTACASGLHKVCPGTVTTQDPKTLEITVAGACTCPCHARANA
jgi:hypothetical protein